MIVKKLNTVLENLILIEPELVDFFFNTLHQYRTAFRSYEPLPEFYFLKLQKHAFLCGC